MLICWVIIGNVYPVIEFPIECAQPNSKYLSTLLAEQKNSLYHRPQKTQTVNNYTPVPQTTVYDSHFVVVRPFVEEFQPQAYIPCELDNKIFPFEDAYDEVVIFQENHILPMYLVEL